MGGGKIDQESIYLGEFGGRGVSIYHFLKYKTKTILILVVWAAHCGGQDFFVVTIKWTGGIL